MGDAIEGRELLVHLLRLAARAARAGVAATALVGLGECLAQRRGGVGERGGVVGPVRPLGRPRVGHGVSDVVQVPAQLRAEGADPGRGDLRQRRRGDQHVHQQADDHADRHLREVSE
ncbi:hypothetical protein AB3M89_05265 [Microbacterium sp. 179-I 3D2 NHS]|uniref:hypothetical protein n=1 Tax=Microbacterium sp. 179-I 3D2 NHS TaxID=3235178 RepID=UPI0039A1119B